MLRRIAGTGAGLLPHGIEGEGKRSPSIRLCQVPAKAIIPATVAEAQPQLGREGEAVAEGGQAVAELELQPLCFRSSLPSPLAASPSRVVRFSRAAVLPVEELPMVWIKDSAAPRSEAGCCCQDREPEKTRSWKPSAAWESRPCPRRSIDSSCSGDARRVKPPPRSRPKPVSASPPTPGF